VEKETKSDMVSEERVPGSASLNGGGGLLGIHGYQERCQRDHENQNEAEKFDALNSKEMHPN